MEFIKDHWDEMLSILAIIVALTPLVINFFLRIFQKIHYIFLDEKIIPNVKADVLIGCHTEKTSGCLLILALNVFLYGKSFFPHKIECHISFDNGTKAVGTLYEGTIGFKDHNGEHFAFSIPDKDNVNTNRLMTAESDNIRVVPFLFRNVNFDSLTNIKKIKIVLYGRVLRKCIVIKPEKCVYSNILEQYMKKDSTK